MDNTATENKEQKIDEVLKERGSRYGRFSKHATITQRFKNIQREKQVKSLSFTQQEAIDMIFHKLGRIINGDPDYADSWIDIAGYAQLVVEEIEKLQARSKGN